MQGSPNLNEGIQIIRVRYLGEEMFQKVKIPKFPISDF